MPVHVMVRAEPGVCKPPPFAQLPHDIAADPRLTPVDVRVIAALLFWARDKAVAWPSDASIASRVGRAVATVQRSLRRLQALGLIRRDQVEPSDRNRTGRLIRLLWRVDPPCETPRSPMSIPPRSSVIDEGRSERERERQPSDAGSMSPPPTGGNEEGDVPPSAEEVARFHAWANGPDPVKARFGRAALKLAGIDPETECATGRGDRSTPAEHPPCPAPLPAPVPAGISPPPARGASAPGCSRPMEPTPRGARVDRHRGPEVPTAPGALALEGPADLSPMAPRCLVPSAPIAAGAPVRGCRWPQPPRPPGPPGPWDLGTRALRLGGVLAREGP